MWRRGSVVGSWLVDLTADAFARSPDLGDFAGRVSDSGEGRWTVEAAIETGVPAAVITAALYERFESRGNGELHRQDPLGHALGVRRPRREEGVAMEHELVIVPDAASLADPGGAVSWRRGRGAAGGRARPVHVRGERRQDPVGDVRRAGPRRRPVGGGRDLPGRRAGRSRRGPRPQPHPSPPEPGSGAGQGAGHARGGPRPRGGRGGLRRAPPEPLRPRAPGAGPRRSHRLSGPRRPRARRLATGWWR